MLCPEFLGDFKEDDEREEEDDEQHHKYEEEEEDEEEEDEDDHEPKLTREQLLEKYRVRKFSNKYIKIFVKVFKLI